MSRNIQDLFKFAFAFIVIVIGNYVIVAQNVVTGDWKAEYKAEKIQLSFSRKAGNGKNRMSSGYDVRDFQGLSVIQVNGTNERVKFSLVREAGNTELEGTFTNGKGAGTFVFTPSKTFVEAMNSRGFNFEKADNENSVGEKLFAAATLNVTTALADDLLAANFGKLDTGDLFKAAIFRIDGKFAREMKETGFQNLTFDDLVKARIFKIDAEFVRQVAQMGFDKEEFESLVKMQIFKITPDFINEIRSEGFNEIEIEDLVKMRIFKIDGAFIREARSEGVPLEVEKLVQKRLGVWKK